MFLKRKLLTFLLLTWLSYTKTQGISDSINAFSIDLLTATSNDPNCPKNLVLSPYTVWSLLSIIDEGARDITAQQIENVLRIPGPSGKNAFRNSFKNLSNIISKSDKEVELDSFGAIFTNEKQTLKRTFQEVSKKHYNVDVQPIDFSNTRLASDKINNLVARATKNRITDFVHPQDLNFAEIFILSALHFKGTWMNTFNRSLTKRETFYDEKQNKLGQVDMMYQMGFFPYSRLDWIKGHAVELPYGEGDKMSMIVILPYRDQTVDNMLQLIKSQQFIKIIDKLEKAKEEFEGEDVKVYLPRFKISTDLNLNIILEKMGIVDMFDFSKANLLGMFQHYLYVSNLIQRAEIEVNEEGTVADAAAGASIANKITPPKFLVNKPFLFFIVNKPTKSIMFGGKVTVPPPSKP